MGIHYRDARLADPRNGGIPILPGEHSQDTPHGIDLGSYLHWRRDFLHSGNVR